MLEQLISFLRRYAEGNISYSEFNETMFLIRDLVDETNSLLDGTVAMFIKNEAVGDQELRDLVGQLAAHYAKAQLVTA